MTNPMETPATGEAWIAPDIRELSVDDTHATQPLGTDGGNYPSSTS